jgi:hypothetical protein
LGGALSNCWERRGCDDAMRAGCPHAADPAEQCPARCSYGQCYRPTRSSTGDPALVFDVSIDRSAAAMESCLYCEFFLINGPRVS